MKITYHIDRTAEKNSIAHVFLTIWDSVPDCNPGLVMVYSPIGQHSEASIEYVRKARKISVKEYLRMSEGIYTPEEYILT